MSKVKEFYETGKTLAKDWTITLPLALAGAEEVIFTVAGPHFWETFGNWNNYGIPFRADTAAHVLLGFAANRTGRRIFEIHASDNKLKQVGSGALSTTIIGTTKELFDSVRHHTLDAFDISDMIGNYTGALIDDLVYYTKEKIRSKNPPSELYLQHFNK